MFETISERFSDTLRRLSGKGKITEGNIQEAMQDVRNALLEADVHHDVARRFCDQCVQKAMGREVLKSLRPAQQMIGIVYEELTALMSGGDAQYAHAGSEIMLVSPGPTVIMMCGLQGSGKTTTCGKLAAHLRQRGKSVMLCAADLQRPAAVQQLGTLAQQVREQVEGRGQVLFHAEMDKVAEYGKAVGAAVKVCQNALKSAREQKVDVLILDTAGRLHINSDLMDELKRVNQAINPHQVLLVIDAMTGQDAVNSARAFNEQLELDGVVLTKFDSDTRGGAALTVRYITGKPIKFVGMGEKLAALQPFYPDRAAERMLGMGDIRSLVEAAQQQVDVQEAQRIQDKLAQGKLTMDDFLGQLKAMRKMGSMKHLLGMLPGVGSQLKDLDIDEKQVDRTEAIIKSMTPDERRDVDLLTNSRRRRIARGSGTDSQDVSQLVKGFEMVSNLGKQMSSMSLMQRMKAMAGLGHMDLAAMAGRPPKLAAPQVKKSGGSPRRNKRSR